MSTRGARARRVDTVVRRLAHEPTGGVPRLCTWSVPLPVPGGFTWRQDMSQAADPRAKLSAGGGAKRSRGCGRPPSDGGAYRPGPGRPEEPLTPLSCRRRARSSTIRPGVKACHWRMNTWRHTLDGDKYVTVILDVTPIRDRSGPLRLLDMVRAAGLQNRLASQLTRGREHIRCRYGWIHRSSNAAAEKELPTQERSRTLHVVHLAGNADGRRRRIPAKLHRRRRSGP